MNLLPWREKQRKKQAIKLIIHWLLLSFMIIIALFFLLNWQQKMDNQIRQKQQNIVMLKRQLSTVEGEVQQLRQHTIKRKRYAFLEGKNIAIILNTLPFIPIQQGELQRVIFDAEKLVLQGIALNQQEFSEIEQFIMQNPQFTQQKLTAFNPTTQNIYFEFTLYFKGDVHE